MSDAALSLPYAPPTAAVDASQDGVRFRYSGTGGELFKTLFVGFLLTAITFGIYAPWFAVGLYKYIFSKTAITTRRGELQFEFAGTGGQFFVTALVGSLLMGITFGIYGPWYIARMLRFFAQSSTATAQDGTKYQLRFDGTGGDLFVTFLVGSLLTGITFGIYAPWYICKLNKLIYTKTSILENGEAAGSLDFVGTGGDLFVTFLVGMLLTGITFGIYSYWFQMKLNKFINQNTRLRLRESTWAADFHGTGGQFFVLNLVGGLLMAITFGIYSFWFITKLMKFQLENTSFQEASA